jgi:hypothetical protein
MTELDEMVREVCAEADATAADYERWQRGRTVKREGGFNLVYKVTENARLTSAQPTMTPEEQEPWDRWVDAQLRKQFDGKYRAAITQFVSEYVTARLAPLQNEIGGLRAELEVLRSVVVKQNGGGGYAG